MKRMSSMEPIQKPTLTDNGVMQMQSQMEELNAELNKHHSLTSKIADELKAAKRLLVAKEQEAEVASRRIQVLEASNQELLSMSKLRTGIGGGNLGHVAASVVARSQSFRSRK